MEKRPPQTVIHWHLLPFLFRLGTSVLALLVIVTMTFFFLRLIPGGPFDGERVLPPEIKSNIEKKFGLDQPLLRQYSQYMIQAAKGDFGPSFKYLGRSTKEIIAETLPVSAQLGAGAFLLGLISGLFMGFTAAFYRGSLVDRSLMAFTSLGSSLPQFIIAGLLVLIMSIHLKILPPALWEGPRYFILPVLTLALYPACYLAQMTRRLALETLSKDYILTARAKGLNELDVFKRHVLRSVAPTILTVLGPMAATLLTGSFIVEVLYAIPGMGQHFVTAVTNRDYPLVLGITAVQALFMIAFNFLVDCLQSALTPTENGAP